MPVWDFFGAGHHLRVVGKPISITLSRGEELWFAENEHLDIFATGESRDDAIREFHVLLVHFYQHYSTLDEEKALKRARRLKRLFRERFTEGADEG